MLKDLMSLTYLYPSLIEELHLFPLSSIFTSIRGTAHCSVVPLVCYPPSFKGEHEVSMVLICPVQIDLQTPGGTEQCHHRSLKPHCVSGIISLHQRLVK